VSPEFGKAGSNLLGTVVTTKRRPAAGAPRPEGPVRGERTRPQEAAAAPEPSIFRRHAADLWAIGLITLGVLLALALWGRRWARSATHVDTGLATWSDGCASSSRSSARGAGVVLLIERERPEPLRTGLGALLGSSGSAGSGSWPRAFPHDSTSRSTC
jgi:hypothetical protein